ncbi:MAG TPA: anti-sigma factor, partial [Candidatus Nitrosotalea sp.]|nr:anti-sigma factor [Candidatus Nitrosotalea sp.]
KTRIMKEVRAQAAMRKSRAPWRAYAVAAAAFAIAILSGLLNLSLNDRLSRERAERAAATQIVTDLTASDLQRHPFAGGEVLARGAHLYIAMHDLPQPPAGHVYQAWTLAKGAKTVAPSVTFRPTGGVAVVRLPQDAARQAAVAVSVEPEGGSRQPTTKPIALVRI